MKKGVIIFWSVFAAAALVRVILSLQVHPPDMADCVGQMVRGEGVISEEPERKEAGQVLAVTVETVIPQGSELPSESSCAAGVVVRMKTKLYPKYAFEDRISFVGKLSKPINFKSDGGRTFDYEGYLAKDDIFYEIKSATVAKINAAENSKSPSFIARATTALTALLFKLKLAFVSHLDRVLGEPHSALAAGLVVGEKSALGKNLLEDFRTVGLIHIVVLSGFNITIVADALRRMLSFLPRLWGIIIGGIGIALFGILVGGGATVVRSCFMASIALSADIIRRDYNVVRALAFAALVMLIQNPMILLHDPSFQLSFLATLGLIMLASPIESKLQFIPEKFGIRGIVSATVATQIFVSPFILYTMGQISLIGMVVNILVLPLIPATMLVVFLCGAGGFISLYLAQFFGWAAHLLLSYELFMVEWFARVPYAALHIAAFSGWITVCVYGVILCGYGIFMVNRRVE